MPLLLHLRACPACHAALAFTAAAASRPAGAVRAPAAGGHSGIAGRALIRRLALWRRRIETGTDALAASAGEGRVVFRSAEGTPDVRAWKAELLLSGTDAGTPVLSIRMLPADGRPAPAEGRFRLFGTEVSLQGGSASLPSGVLADATAASGGVAYIAPDGTVTPGLPVLADFD